MTWPSEFGPACRSLAAMPPVETWTLDQKIAAQVYLDTMRQHFDHQAQLAADSAEGKSRHLAAGRTATKPQKARKRLPPKSAKRIAEGPAREAVRVATIARAGHRCEGPTRGLPGDCMTRPSPDRPPLEVHETTARGTHPGSHLDLSCTVALCQYHHDMCTSPQGEVRKLVESLGLLVRAGALPEVRSTKEAR